MVDTMQPHSLSSFRTQKRRHDHRMNRLRTKNPRSLPTLRRLERTQTFLLLPVAGGVFFLDSPLYRTALPSSGASGDYLSCRGVSLRLSRIAQPSAWPASSHWQSVSAAISYTGKRIEPKSAVARTPASRTKPFGPSGIRL